MREQAAGQYPISADLGVNWGFGAVLEAGRRWHRHLLPGPQAWLPESLFSENRASPTSSGVAPKPRTGP